MKKAKNTAQQSNVISNNSTSYQYNTTSINSRNPMPEDESQDNEEDD